MRTHLLGVIKYKNMMKKYRKKDKKRKEGEKRENKNFKK